MALAAMAPASTDTLTVIDGGRTALPKEELCPFDEQQSVGIGIKSKSKKRDKINNTGNSTKRKPSSTKRRAKKPSSTTRLKENVNAKTKSTRATTSDDVAASRKTRRDEHRKNKEPNGSSSSARISNRSIEHLSNSKIMDIINPIQVNDKNPNDRRVNARNSNRRIECDNSKIGDIILSRSDERIHRSSFSRILPERPALEVARDKKRVLEICYESENRKVPLLSTTLRKDESPKSLDDVSPDKTLPTDDDSDDASMHKAEKKERKDTKKPKKKKKNLKEGKVTKDGNKEVTAAKHENDEDMGVGPLHGANDRIVGSPKKGKSQIQDELNATKSDDLSTKEGKIHTVKRRIPSNNGKKRRIRRPVVQRDAAGKVVRRRIKGRGRDRVVRKEFFRKGKDANISLATIDEGFYDNLSGDSSDDDWLTKSYQSSNMSGADTDDCGDDNQLTSFNRISISGGMSKCGDKKGGDENFDPDSNGRNSNVSRRSGSGRGIDQRPSKSVERLQGEDIHGIRPVNTYNDIQQHNNGAIEVSLSNGVSASTTEQSFPGDDPNETIGRTPNTVGRNTPNNQDVITPNESGVVVDTIPDTNNNNDDNNGDHIPSLRSIPSVDSTACTSTAEAESERDGKLFYCFRSYQSMICASISFVVLVAAATVMVVYFLTFRNGFDGKPIATQKKSPTNVPNVGERPSLRPSNHLSSTTEPCIFAPTLAPTTRFDTLSTTCQVPDDKPGTAMIEIEYASELFGLASISNTNTGYCGVGYITDLTRSGSGFGLRSFNVETTGYYKVVTRYSYTDQTRQSFRLQIDDRNEGTLDLVPTRNQTSWLIDSFDDILLRKGEHTIGMWVQLDGEIGPSVDWITLSLQKPVTTFEYLSAIIERSSSKEAQLTVTQTRTLNWMANDDPLDWSTLTDREIIERYALIQIYHATEGEAWINNNQWLSEFHACSWYGITCSINMLVTDLMLDNNGLVGYLPADISWLTNLILISLDNNDLQGIIPTELGKLSNLSKLFLHANFLSGFLPSELGWLEYLDTFDVRANFLYGTIPKELYSMVRLQSLALGSNILSGTLSTQVEYLKALKHLDLQVNSLSGTIPSQLGELTLLSSLALGYNWFTGTIPGELGLLQNLTVLDVNSNRLTGMLPPELRLLNDTIIDYYGNDIII